MNAHTENNVWNRNLGWPSGLRCSPPSVTLILVAVIWLFAFAVAAQAADKIEPNVHPGIPFTIGDLAAVKSNLNTQPWASGYAALVADGQPQCYAWEYVYGALEVLEGGAPFRFMPSVNLDFSRDFLRQLAASDPAAKHVVIQDQAGFPLRAGGPGLPDRIHLLPWPPYSPELNPIEGLWDQV